VVTPDLFRRADEPVEHPWLQPGQPPVLLGVGRLTRQKNFPNLIRAFARVRTQQPSRLMILGEGEDRSALETLIAELGLQGEVSLPGFVQNPYAYMKRAAMFVLSSDWEGLPTVLIEALALGTPVVSTNCPSGPMEILRGGVLGRLVPMQDAEALAQAITASLSEPFKPVLEAAYADYTQAVVVQQGIVLGVEAVEGTDALVRRCAGLKREGPGGVLVKVRKPGQDRRLDLPTIGPATLREAAAAGLRGIVVQAGGALVLDNSEWPKYQPAFGILAGWPVRHFCNGVWRTSVFLRPETSSIG